MERFEEAAPLYLKACEVEGKTERTVQSYVETLRHFIRAVDQLQLPCPQQRDNRLDTPGERASQSSRPGPPHPAQTWLPTGQAGEGDHDGARAGGGPVGGMGTQPMNR